MSRAMIALDRLAVLVLAIVLVALGLVTLEWRYATLVSLPDTVDLTGLQSATDAAWWPWATGVTAAVLILLALRWLLAHLPPPAPQRTKLSGSDATGLLEVDAESVARAAAAAAKASDHVSGARGRVRRGPGGAYVDVVVDVLPHADVEVLQALAARTCAEVATAFPSGDLGCRLVVNRPRRRVTDVMSPATASPG